MAGAWTEGGERREAELERWAGPGRPGPWKGFSDIYRKVSRRPLGSYWSTGFRVVAHNPMCVSRGVRIAGAQLGGHGTGPGESWR